jgi:hypothetical protein
MPGFCDLVGAAAEHVGDDRLRQLAGESRNHEREADITAHRVHV